MKLLQTVIRFVVEKSFVALFLAAGLFFGWVFWADGENTDKAPAVSSSGPQVWTCSMHPQIRQPTQGLCPICEMDLIPASTGDGGGLRTLSLSADQKRQMGLETAPVERRTAHRDLRLVGKVAHDETRLGYITARFAGRLDRLFVDYSGVAVQEGDHMVEIYSPDLLIAQEELIQAARALDDARKQTFPELKASAESTLNASRRKLSLWGLTEEQVQEIEESRTPSDHMTLYSPMGGIVLEKNAKEGQYVQTGTTLYTICDLDRVWIQLDAYESDLVWLRYGQSVRFESEAYPGEWFAGTVSFIDPVLDAKTRTVKVRVNADNETGRLKPGLFVRAVIEAHVGEGGRVMDPSLEGQHICPMHPEIIKDDEGDCDMCGMDLVPSSQLGFVSQGDVGEPLVIPASSVLITGRRAIVYVEQEGEEGEPVYAGREIVLGPRAGDLYLVAHGLEEGERVVTAGNFKIDSALQLQAQPSMMNPDPVPATSPMIGDSLQWKLQRLENERDVLMRIFRDRTLDETLASLKDWQSAFEEIESMPIPEDALAWWDEHSMHVRNDLFEAHRAADREELGKALETLAHHFSLLRETFGLEKAAPQGRPLEGLPPDLITAIKEWLAPYTTLHDRLAHDDEAQAHEAVKKLANELTPLNIESWAASHQEFWRPRWATFENAMESMMAAKDIEALRVGFSEFSTAFVELIELGQIPLPRDVHVMYCSMAFNDEGGVWLQFHDSIQNPYYGSSMYRCGSVVSSHAASDDQ